MTTSKTNCCPYCGVCMSIQVMHCQSCSVSVEADYQQTRLGGLPMEHQRFIEMFVLASGSLKEIAKQTGVSYPTVRSRLDRIIEELRSRITGSVSSDTILDALQSDQETELSVDQDRRASARDLIKRI